MQFARHMIVVVSASSISCACIANFFKVAAQGKTTSESNVSHI